MNFLVSKDLDNIEYSLFYPSDLDFVNKTAEKNKLPYRELMKGIIKYAKKNIDAIIEEMGKQAW